MFMNWENENKISVFSKLIYRFKALNQNHNYFFFFLEWEEVVKIDKLSLKCIQKCKESKTDKTTLKRKNKAGDYTTKSFPGGSDGKESACNA